MNKLSDKKTEKVADIIKPHYSEITNLLVVEYGSGLEASILSQRLGVNVLEINALRVSDARALKHVFLSSSVAV